MPLPGGLATVVVSGEFLDAAGTALAGRVTFTPTADLTDPANSLTIPAVTRIYQLSRGQFVSDPLIATDNETVTPANWAYTVAISLRDLDPVSYEILLPQATTPVDLSALTPVVAQPAMTAYLTLAGGTLAGTLVLDGDPHPLQIPAGAAPGDVLTSDAEGNASWGPVTATGLTVFDYTQPSGATAATIPRRLISTIQSVLVSGTMYVTAISMPAGVLVNNITMYTATTGKTGGTHGWYILCDSGMVCRAVTADQTDPSTVWGSQRTFYTLPTNAYTTTYTGLYYIGVMVAESAGTMPTFYGAIGMPTASGSPALPVFCGTSSTGQTTPPSAGTSMTALTPAVNYTFYAYTS